MQSLVSMDSTWDAGSRGWRMAATGNPSAVRLLPQMAVFTPNQPRAQNWNYCPDFSPHHDHNFQLISPVIKMPFPEPMPMSSAWTQERLLD